MKISIIVAISLGILLLILYICLRFMYLPSSKDTFERMTRKEIEQKVEQRNNRVVVSFSTIPSRIKYVPKVIEEINKQSFHPDVIYACIPYYSKRLQEEYIIPDFGDLGDNVRIVRGEDFGPATKLLGCIPYENDPETIIITIDDDQTYARNTLQTLVAYGEKYPNSVCSFHAMGKDLGVVRCPMRKNINHPGIYYIEGFGGVLYRRKFVTEEMIDYFENDLSRDCFMSDDLVISTWMEIQGIPRKKLCDILNVRGTKGEIDKNNALHREDRKGVYSKCHKEMLELESRFRRNKEFTVKEISKDDKVITKKGQGQTSVEDRCINMEFWGPIAKTSRMIII